MQTLKDEEEKVNEVTAKGTKGTPGQQQLAKATWGQLETVFEARVERALTRLGVPTNKEIATLTRRVEELTRSVATLTKAGPAAKRTTRARKAA
jgi:poly(hydroxyalkanoate) granule-associated protein